MIIKRVELEDFGRFSKLECDMDAPVVGLIAPNSYGKTLLLTAIRFLLCSELPRTAETYVRDFTSPTGARNARLTMDFEHSGRRGRLFRQIGATSAYELVWDGQKYTRVVEGERVMNELLGGNRQAIANTIFAMQGELDRMMFGTQGEREELLQKLLMITHLSRHAKLIDTQCNVHKAGLTDMQPLIDNLNNQRSTLSDTLRTAEVDLMNIPDPLREINQILSWRQQEERVSGFVRDLAKTAADHEYAREQQRQALRLYVGDGPIPSPEELLEKIRMLREKQGQVRDRVSELRKARSDYELYTAKSETYSKLLMRQMELQERQADLPFASVIKGRLEKLAAQIPLVTAYFNAVDTAEQAARQNAQALQTPEPAPFDPDGSWRVKVDGLVHERSFLQMQLKLITAMGTGVSGECCPLCRQALVNASLPDRTSLQTRLDAVGKEISEYDAAKTRFERLSAERSRILFAAESAAKSAQASFEAAKTALLSLPENSQFSGLTAFVGRQELEKLRALQLENQRKSAEIEANAKALADVDRELLAYADFDSIPVPVLPAEASDESLQEMQKRVQEYQAEIQRLETYHGQLRNTINEIEQRRARHAQVSEQLVEGRRTLGLLEAALPPLQEGENRETALERLQQVQRKRLQMEGEINAMRQQMDTLRKSLEDAEVTQAGFRNQQRLAMELKEIQALFANSGLSQAYANRRFADLLELTNETLQQMDSNFSVRPDPNAAVSFQFMRLDRGGEVWLPQGSLSGGQRVRFTLALLLAVQRLLLPQVGLLVVDEPSLHLDAEGRAQLADLLMQIGGAIAGNSAQVIVADHAVELLPAYQRVVDLSVLAPLRDAEIAAGAEPAGADKRRTRRRRTKEDQVDPVIPAEP